MCGENDSTHPTSVLLAKLLLELVLQPAPIERGSQVGFVANALELRRGRISNGKQEEIKRDSGDQTTGPRNDRQKRTRRQQEDTVWKENNKVKASTDNPTD